MTIKLSKARVSMTMDDLKSDKSYVELAKKLFLVKSKLKDSFNKLLKTLRALAKKAQKRAK